jgi:hypothetical protein
MELNFPGKKNVKENTPRGETILDTRNRIEREEKFRDLMNECTQDSAKNTLQKKAKKQKREKKKFAHPHPHPLNTKRKFSACV